MTEPHEPAAIALPENGGAALARGLDADGLAVRVRTALGDGLAEVTVADAAARSGVSLAEAERGLHRLSRRHRGHVAVTDKGELLFRFPQGFVVDYERRDARRVALARLGRGATTVATWIARLALTVFLVGYSLVFAVGLLVGAIVLSIVAEDSAPLEGFGFLMYGLSEVLVEGIFWSTHPALAQDGQARALRDEESKSHLYERINRVFFGPALETEDPLAARRLLAQEIRSRRGRIGRSDVERVTGLVPSDADALLSSMLVDFDGHVEVSDDGAIFYVFAALRPTAQLAVPLDAPVPPAWLFRRGIPEYIGNPEGSTFRIGLLWTFVTLLAAAGVGLDLPWYLAELPLFTALGLAAIPVLRLPAHRRRVRRALEDNGHRALLALVHACARARCVLQAEQAIEAWTAATGQRPGQPAVERRLIELGGDLEIAEDGSTGWRFAELQDEQRALGLARASADDDERSTGAVVFRSDD